MLDLIKHSEEVKAFLDGAEIQFRPTPSLGWIDTSKPVFEEGLEYRIKPATVRINGVECPAPYKGLILSSMHYHCESPGNSTYQGTTLGYYINQRLVEMGAVHETREGAVTSCKARYNVVTA